MNLTRISDGSGRSSLVVLAMLAMVAVPAALTLHTAKVSAVVDVTLPDPSPHGYTVSLLLFLVPIVTIGGWLIPQEGVHVSKKAFGWTIGLLFPLGAMLDFFFARKFLTFGNAGATLGIKAPALGGGVPIEEYLFYLLGFIAVLLIYIWLDEYWLAAYGLPGDADARTDFARLVHFHPASAIWAVVLVGAAILYRKLVIAAPGFPGYFTFLALGSLGPSMGFYPSVRGMINWRAFSLTTFFILLTSLLWEATLGVPYRWWGYQPAQMMGVSITAWGELPLEAVVVWIAVTWETVIVYEVLRRWQASGRTAREAFFGFTGSAV